MPLMLPVGSSSPSPALLVFSALSLGISLPGCLSKLTKLEPGAAETESSVNPATPNESVTTGRPGTESQQGLPPSSAGTGSADTRVDSESSCSNCEPEVSDAKESSAERDAGGLGVECTSGSYWWRRDAGPSECRPCEAGAFSFDDDAESCVPHGVCEAGSFTIGAGTPQRDVVCAGCQSGFFAAESGLDACVKWRDCEPGEFVKESGSDRADRQCEACADGETSVLQNAGACTAADECAAGFVQVAAAGDGEGPECEPCFAGTYCAGGEEAAVICGSEQWDNDANAATPCVDKTVCLAGKYVADAGSSTTDRTCSDCVEGYSVNSNAEECDDWSTCERGQYVVSAGTTQVDRTCGDCDDGTFSEMENAVACEMWRTCSAPDEYETGKPTLESDRECGKCELPERARGDNAEACEIVAFQMASGQVSMEAEHFHFTAGQSSDEHEWQELELSGTSGGHCLELTPDVDATWLTSPATTAPKLEYSVNFTQTGSFYIHVRGDTGAKTVGTSDSCFAGIDGVATNSYMFSNVSGAWIWNSQPASVSTTGVHIVQIFGREDGFRIDKIVVSTSSVPPTGEGPAESEQL